MSGQQATAGDALDGDVAVSQAAVLASSTYDSLTRGRTPNPLPVRRVVMDLLQSGTTGLSEETTAYAGEASFGAHTSRVTLLSLVIGRALGLEESALQDLGVAAMFHDVGYAAREGATPADPGFAPPRERHGTAGARILIRQRGFHEAKVLRALAAIQHMSDFDTEPQPSLFARVIRIAEDYDNMTRPGGDALSPTLAISRLASGAGTVYDPVLVQLFVNVLGRYPPGTRLVLADGRTVVVTSTVRSPETFARPLTEVVPAGAQKVEVDLAVEGSIARVLTG